MTLHPSVYLALDLGGTRFRVAAFTDDGALVHRSDLGTAPGRGLQAVLEHIEAVLRQAAAAAGPPRAVGVAAPGPLNPWTGVLYDPPNLPGWTEVHLKEELERRLSVPVYAGNDANLAAIGEATFGAGRGSKSLCYFTISTGIGGGIIENGKMVLGSRGFAGEFGHQTVLPNGPLCGCGGKGHLEALASGTAIARIARERLQSGAQSSILTFAADDVGAVVAEHVVDAARDGDHVARLILDEVVGYLAIGIANVIHLLDPEIVVLGGGVMRAADLMLDPIRLHVEELLMSTIRKRVRIEQATLGDDSGLWGAYVLAKRSLAS